MRILDRLRLSVDAVIALSWACSYYISLLFPAAIAGLSHILLLVIYLGILFALTRERFLHLRLDMHVVRSAVLGSVFVLILFEPVFVSAFHFSALPPLIFLEQLLFVFLYGIFFQVFLFNFNAERAVRRGDRTAINLPFVLFLSTIFQLNSILFIVRGSPVTVLNFTLSAIAGIVLFYLLFIMYVKFRFNNLPGIVFYVFYSVPALFSVSYSSSPILSSAWIFVDFSVVLIMLELLVRDNVYSIKLTRPGNPVREKRNKSSVIITLGVVAVMLAGIFVVAPIVMGTAHPFLTDPTGSMYPVIKPNSLLIVRGTGVQSIQVGQILVFTAPWDHNLTVAHEVIRILNYNGTVYFQTKGIANSVQDPLPVPAYDVRGIVVTSIPYLGYLFIYSYAFLSAILIAVAIIGTVKFK